MKTKRKLSFLSAAALITAILMSVNICLCCIAAAEETAGGVELPDVTIGAGEPLSTDCRIFTFDNEDTYIGLFDGRVTDVTDVSFDAEKKCFVLAVSESTDPFIELLFGVLSEGGIIEPVSADKYKVIQFGVRFDTAAGREGQFYFQTKLNPDYQEAQNLSYLYSASDDLQYVNVDASGNARWTGEVSDCRFDLLTTSKTDIDFELYYVGFFENTASADAYGAEWLKAHGVEEGGETGPETGEGPEAAGKDPAGLILFDTRAGDVNIALGESLFDTETVSQIDSSFADKNSNSYKVNIVPGEDPFIEMMFGALTESKAISPVPCSKYKVMQIALKTNTAGTSGTGTLYFQTDVFSGYGETKNIHYKYYASEGLQFLNVDFTPAKLWEGNVANCRFDMFENVTADTELDIYYIAFFADREAADEFAEKYTEWSEKGGTFPAEFPVKPTAAPTAVPTEKPLETDAPATEGNGSGNETKDPSATADPGKDPGAKTDGKSNFPVVPVVIGAAVLVAAVIAVAVVMAKKKKR